MKCKIPNCNKDVACETEHNNRMSNKYCVEHTTCVTLQCIKCGKKLKSRAIFYKENYICKSCKLSIRNSSEESRKRASERIKKLNSDPEFKKKNSERMTKYNKEHRDELIERGRTLGITKGRDNLLNFIGSDKQKEHLIKLNNSEEHKKKLSDSLLKRWKDPEQRRKMLSGFTNEHRIKLLKIFSRQFEDLELIDGVCRKCGKETRVTKDFYWCKDCKPNNNSGCWFDRDYFYQSKIDRVNIDYLNQRITLEDIDNLIGIPGVWCKSYIDKDGKEVCLDVSQTKDIGKEMLWSLRVFDSNANKKDYELKQDNQLSLRKKYRDMYDYSNGKILFKIIAIYVENKDTREYIEMQYAYDNKAMFWSPAPGQYMN